MISNLTMDELLSINSSSIKQAGARYTPGLDPDAPNLEVQELVEATNALAHSQELVDRLGSLSKKLDNLWGKTSKETKLIFKRVKTTPATLAVLLPELGKQAPGTSSALMNRIRRNLATVEDRLRKRVNKIYEERTDPIQKSGPRDIIAYGIHDIQTVQSAVSEISNFVRSPEFELVQKNLLFIRGGWGSGKTHLLCDLAKRYSEKNLPALLLLAQSLRRGCNPLAAGAEAVGLTSGAELLSSLNKLGKAKSCRALLIVDGINEGDRAAWRNHIGEIAEQIRKFPNVGVILSCRTPFESQIVTEKSSRLFVQLNHTGFSDIEFDAQKEFFKHYDIPTPHVPLLAPEFSKPLFLKILCETLSALGKPARKRRINEFAAGHKGMTKLLEDFVRHVGMSIESDFGIPPLSCWKILKGQGDSALAVGLAPLMAKRGVDYLSRSDCEEIIRVVTAIEDKAAVTGLLSRMVNDGLLTEEVIFEGDWKEIIRLPYQRFSDHLISRHLLAQFLDTSSETSIRKSFYKNRPLGKVLALENWGHNFKMPNLVSAIMLEFPERVKRTYPPKSRELLFYLPKGKQLRVLIAPFIEGLLWRNIDSFGEQTELIVQRLLNDRDRAIQLEVLEALVSLASRHKHPYNASSLYGRLQAFDLPTRDLFWSEFLRSCEKESAVYRVMDWVQRGDCDRLESAVVDNLIRLNSLFLTTTARTLRDRATKCLVLLGDFHPDVLVTQTLESFQFDDPYMRERMLAAAYGSMMRRWAFPPPKLHAAASALTADLSRRLQGSKNEAPLEHVLMREYAEGIVHLSNKIRAKSIFGISASSKINISRKSIVPRIDRIPDSVLDAAKPAIHMDFGNYTIGRIVPNRGNYDYNNLDYKAVLKQISWRIIDLGFDWGRFKSVDGEIGSSNFRFGRADNGQKVDRYGKKYSWIAYYEVAGRKQLSGKLREIYDARISATDLDPSFPDPALAWNPPLKPIFQSTYTGPAAWMEAGPSPDYSHLLTLDEIQNERGPWVLIHGYVGEKAQADPRELFTFLRGLLIAPGRVKRLKKLTQITEYPGNRGIPDLRESYYLFAGEIGSSNKYGGDLRGVDGTARPHVGRVFDQRHFYKVQARYGDLQSWEQFGLLKTIDYIIGQKGVEKSDSILPMPDENDLVEVERSKLIPGVKVELPAWRFAWESYHSEENNGGSPEYPAPALVDVLGLRKRGGEVDLVDSKGRRAMMCREYGKDYSGFRSDLLYLRADLMELYLKITNQNLVWINWGERTLHHETIEHVRESPDMRKVWGAHAHIHKSFHQYKLAYRT